MSKKFDNLSPELQKLVNSVSAMSADQFNACLSAAIDYQAALNTWMEYSDGVIFDSEVEDPLPDAENYFDLIQNFLMTSAKLCCPLSPKRSMRA